MKTFLVTAAFAALLWVIYPHSHSTAIIAGAVGIVVILAEGNLHFARVRRGASR